MVEIVVVNNVPDDLFSPQPPLYLLASSITLVCHVYGSIGDVEYSWMTTAASNFTFNSESQFNRKPLLTFDDAGVYTCSASDSAGKTGEANTEIKTNGENSFTAIYFAVNCIEF